MHCMLAPKNNEESSGDFYQYQPYWNNDSFVTRSETGYYLTSDRSGLSYLDNKSKELTLLCGDSTCTHTTKDCSANKDMEPYTIRYSGDKLYYIGSPSIGTVSLSRSDKDGTNEEVLGDLFTMASKTQVSIHFEVHCECR